MKVLLLVSLSLLSGVVISFWPSFWTNRASPVLSENQCRKSQPHRWKSQKTVISGRRLQQKTLVSVNHLFPSNTVCIINAVGEGLSFSENVFLDKFEVDVQLQFCTSKMSSYCFKSNGNNNTFFKTKTTLLNLYCT